jgi:hypothetical protein
MSQSKTYFTLLINNQSKRISQSACCGQAILAPCSLASLGIIPNKQTYSFKSEENEFLTEVLGNVPPFLGADVAASIFLNSTGNTKTYLWFFGDTFIGNIVSNQRQVQTMPRNSIGLWTITNNNFETSTLQHYAPTYSNQPGQNVTTYGFFSPVQTNINTTPQNYWPISAIYINNEMYVICERVLSTGLDMLGVDILKLNTIPYNDPSQWTYEYKSTIPGISNNITIGNAFINSDNYVYLYGSINGPKYNGIVTKISYDNFLNGHWELLEVYTNNSWSLYYSSAIPKIIYSPLPLTSAIIWHPYMSKWIMLSIDIFVYGNQVGLFYSDKLEGPWDGPIFIYTVPEKYIISYNILWYAPNFHPEFMINNNTNEIYWSYNINSFQASDLITDLSLYTPKIIRTVVNIYNTDTCPAGSKLFIG